MIDLFPKIIQQLITNNFQLKNNGKSLYQLTALVTGTGITSVGLIAKLGVTNNPFETFIVIISFIGIIITLIIQIFLTVKYLYQPIESNYYGIKQTTLKSTDLPHIEFQRDFIQASIKIEEKLLDENSNLSQGVKIMSFIWGIYTIMWIIFFITFTMYS